MALSFRGPDVAPRLQSVAPEPLRTIPSIQRWLRLSEFRFELTIEELVQPSGQRWPKAQSAYFGRTFAVASRQTVIFAASAEEIFINRPDRTNSYVMLAGTGRSKRIARLRRLISQLLNTIWLHDAGQNLTSDDDSPGRNEQY
jgi:hypothetical protein